MPNEYHVKSQHDYIQIWLRGCQTHGPDKVGDPREGGFHSLKRKGIIKNEASPMK